MLAVGITARVIGIASCIFSKSGGDGGVVSLGDRK
jgi:hypothetical protein